MSKGRKLKIRSDSDDDRAREREKDYMTPSSTILSQGCDETPSLEKHGFWLYPSNSYENIEGCRQNDDGPPSLEEPSQRTLQKRAFTCGCCCCCPCQSMFPAQHMTFPQPMTSPGSFPYFSKRTESPRFIDRTKRQKSKDRQKRKQGGPAVRSVMEEIVEIDGMRDMDMASMVINDAKTNFDKALIEDSPKSPPDRKPSDAQEVGPKRSKEQTEEPLQNELVDEIFELDAMKDMEMASMIMNDSRAIFNQAVDEEKPKQTVTRKDDIPARERRPEEIEDKPRSMQGSAMENKLEVDGMKDMEMASMVINDARSNFNKAVDEEKPKTIPDKKRRGRSKRNKDSKRGQGKERDKKVPENRQTEDGKVPSKAEKDSKKGPFEKEPSKNTTKEKKSEEGDEKASTESSTTMTDKSKVCNKKSFKETKEESKKSTEKTSSRQKSQQKRSYRRKKSKSITKSE